MSNKRQTRLLLMIGIFTFILSATAFTKNNVIFSSSIIQDGEYDIIRLNNTDTLQSNNGWSKPEDNEGLPDNCIPAQYPGGYSELMRYIAFNTRYPRKAIKGNIEGKVLVEFRVNKNGTIDSVRIKKGVHPLLDKEAIRVVKSIPKKWKPFYKDGKPTHMKTTIPITFRLTD